MHVYRWYVDASGDGGGVDASTWSPAAPAHAPRYAGRVDAIDMLA